VKQAIAKTMEPVRRAGDPSWLDQPNLDMPPEPARWQNLASTQARSDQES
jgi:hypothetical protein